MAIVAYPATPAGPVDEVEVWKKQREIKEAERFVNTPNPSKGTPLFEARKGTRKKTALVIVGPVGLDARSLKFTTYKTEWVKDELEP